MAQQAREQPPPLPRAEPLAGLFETVLALQADADGLDRAAQLIAEEGRRELPCCETVVSIMPSHQPSEFRVIAGAGPWAETLVGRRWPLQGTVHDVALRSPEPVEFLAPADRSRFPEVFTAGQIRSGRLIPLVTGASLPGGRMSLGVIGFWSQRAEPFTAAERVVADHLGRFAGLLFLQVEAWHAAERGERRLRLRKAIAEDVQSSLDTVEVVHRTVEHLLEISAADRVTLSTVQDGELTILHSKDRDGEPPWTGERIPLRRALANRVVAQVFEGRQSYRGGAFQPQPGSPFAAELARASHTALVPLVIRSEVTGLIALTRRSGEAFSDDEIAELEISASVAALALRNARLYQQAQAAATARSAFLNLAAHELRTPFAVISGYVALLAEGTFGPAPEAWARPLTVVREKTAELGRLIDQILAASRAESGRFVLKPESFGLADTLRAAIDRARPRIDLYGGSISVALGADPVVRADAGATAIILDNLLNNAVTYRRGTPHLEVSLEGARDRGWRVAVVRIRDNGRGIPAPDFERIFQQFQRLEDPEFSTPAGTGLGLYIARRLADDMGATLTLEWSEPNRGSQFALRLPLYEGRPGSRAPAAPSP